MSVEMDQLVESVTALTTLTDSAVAAFEGLAAQIEDSAGDRQRSLALASDVREKASALAQAIPAGTEPPPEPTLV